MELATGVAPDEVRKALENLRPDIPWTHHFEIAGVETITPEQDKKFYNKSIAVKNLARLALVYHDVFSGGRPLSETRVLDVASAEGAISVAFAQAGAKEVIGIEGREIYVSRANFVTDTLGVTGVRYELGDVRRLSRERHGEFDYTINSGILHHLGQEDFHPFLAAMAEVTRDMMFLYTHVSTPEAVEKFSLRGPVMAAGKFEGFLLQEHAEDASKEERENQVRASLDNTYSFWATEKALVEALKSVGFGLVAKILEPHIFGSYDNRNLRIIFICKKI